MILLILAGTLIGALVTLIVWGEVQAYLRRRARDRHPSWGRWQ